MGKRRLGKSQDFASTLRLVLSGIAGLSLTCIILYSSFSWQDQKEAVLESIVQHSRYQVGLSEDFLSGVAYGIDAIARTAGQSRSIDEHADAMWETLRSSHPEIDSLLITDSRGRVAFNSAGAREDRSPQMLQDLFEMESRGGSRFYLGVPRYDQNFENPEVGVSHVSHDRRGQPMWRVEAKVKLTQLTRRWQSERLPEGAKVMLLHANGYVIAEAGETSADLDRHYSRLVRTVQEARGMEGVVESGQPDMLVAWARLQKQQATVLIALPGDTVLKEWLQKNAVLFVAFGMSLVGYILLAVLVLRRERMHSRQLLLQADTDALTGIPNRAAAERYLAQKILQARREQTHLGVIYIDLDEFKGINDNYGHHSGDKLLVLLTRKLSAVLRGGDLLARLGGDEYLAVVTCTNGDELIAICQRLLESVREPVVVGDRSHRITLSIGASYYPCDGISAEELLKRADIAMYAAKASGRNAYRLFNTEMAEEARVKAEIKAQLELALERDEFELHYQPRFDGSGEVTGVETLLRWRHPVHGLIGPDRFIRYAEESGLIVPIGRLVLERACRQALLWRRLLSRPLAVSINVSVKELEARDFASEALRIVRESGVDPTLIQLEVTESMLSSDPDAVLVCLNTLNAIGVSIELDDFGTGYSSLSYLRKFPIKTIKIDKSFVADIQTVPESRSLIVAIIAMATALNCTVVAEGVENEAQFRFLEACGCRQFQGYFFAFPQTAAEIERGPVSHSSAALLPA